VGARPASCETSDKRQPLDVSRSSVQR
jgi:hypothetical protein